MSNSNRRRRVSQRSLNSCAASISNWLPGRGEATRREVRKRLSLKTPTTSVDQLRDVLVERGFIEVHTKRTLGRPAEVWVWIGGDRRIGRYKNRSHAECDHPSTLAARNLCRAQRAEGESR